MCGLNVPRALVAYEYLITLNDEAYMIFTRWRATTWLFLLNRYMVLFFAIVATAPSTVLVRLPSFDYIHFANSCFQRCGV